MSAGRSQESRRGGAVPVEPSLIEVPMVERRDREAPRYAATQPETALLAGVDQHGSAVAPQVPGPAVAGAEARRVCRNRDSEHTAGSEHARDLGQRARVIGHVLEHLAEDGRVEALVGEGHGRHVGELDRARQATSQDVDRRRRVVDARHVESESRQPQREASLSGSCVEHARTGGRGQEEVEQQAFAQLVPRADELRLRPPLVLGRAHRSMASSSPRQRAPSTSSPACSS